MKNLTRESYVSATNQIINDDNRELVELILEKRLAFIELALGLHYELWPDVGIVANDIKRGLPYFESEIE